MIYFLVGFYLLFIFGASIGAVIRDGVKTEWYVTLPIFCLIYVMLIVKMPYLLGRLVIDLINEVDEELIFDKHMMN